MGLMDIGQNNPYARINPLAAMIEQGMSGWNTERDRYQKLQNERLNQQQQAALLEMKQQDAERKQAAEVTRLQKLAEEAAAKRAYEARTIPQYGFQQGPTEPMQAPMNGLMSAQGSMNPFVDPRLAAMQGPQEAPAPQPVANMGAVPQPPMTQQDMLNFRAQYAGTPTAEAVGQNAVLMGKDKTPQTAWAEKVLGSPKDFDDKSISLANMIMGVDGGGVIRTEKPAYKQRQYEKGNEIIHEYSNDDGKSWLPLSKAPRHKTDSGAAGLRLDDSNRKFAASLRKEFNNLPDVKETNEALPKINSMRKAMEEAKTTNNYVAVDQALISLYNKLTDPTSVVRESEYARTAENLPVLNAIKGKMQKVVKGGAGLTSSDRAALMQMAELMNKGYQDIRNRRVQEYSGYATSGGVDPSHVINDSFRNTLSASSAPTSVPQGAIDQLKANPKLAVYFDQKYGKGASKQYLGR